MEFGAYFFWRSTDTKTAGPNKMAARFNNKYGFWMFSWLWFFLGRLFLFCKQLTGQVSFSLSWIRYLCVQFTSTLTLQQFVYSQTIRTVHTLTLYLNLYTTATSPQRQGPLKHVPNCENNFSTTAIFFSDWWKSQEWSWNLLRMALWRLKSRKLHFDFVSFIYCFLVAFIDKTKISRISLKKSWQV